MARDSTPPVVSDDPIFTLALAGWSGASLHERLKKVRELRGLDWYQVAAEIGVSWQNVRAWELEKEAGGYAPSQPRLLKLANFLHVSVEWLLTGKGANVGLNEKYFFVPLYDRAEVVGGPDAVQHHTELNAYRQEQPDTYATRIEWFSQHQLSPAACRVVRMPDSSMAPALNSGDTLLVHLHDQACDGGHLYVIDTGSSLLVRRCFKRVDGGILLQAANPAYPEETAPRAQLRVVGRVVKAEVNFLL